MANKSIEIIYRYPLKTGKGHFNNTANTNECTQMGKIERRLKWIALWVLKNCQAEQFLNFILFVSLNYDEALALSSRSTDVI